MEKVEIFEDIIQQKPNALKNLVKEALNKTIIGVEMEFQFQRSSYAYKNIISDDKFFNYELNSFVTDEKKVDLDISDIRKKIKSFDLLYGMGNDGGGKEFRFKAAPAVEYINNLDKFAELFNLLQKSGFRNGTGDCAGTHIHLDRSTFRSVNNIIHFIDYNTRSAGMLDKLWRRVGTSLMNVYTFNGLSKAEIDSFKPRDNNFENYNELKAIRSCIKSNSNGAGTFEFRNFSSSFDLRLFAARIVYLASAGYIYSKVENAENNTFITGTLNKIVHSALATAGCGGESQLYFKTDFLFQSLHKLNTTKEVAETVLKPVVA